jgi:antitoxin component HigA of HigAB toxin-antitoxin module
MSGNTPIEGDVVAKFKEGIRQLEISEAIRAAMEKRGLRNQDLVDICGTRARASEIVNGKRAVPKSMAVALAKRLRIPIAKLLV